MDGKVTSKAASSKATTGATKEARPRPVQHLKTHFEARKEKRAAEMDGLEEAQAQVIVMIIIIIIIILTIIIIVIMTIITIIIPRWTVWRRHSDFCTFAVCNIRHLHQRPRGCGTLVVCDSL